MENKLSSQFEKLEETINKLSTLNIQVEMYLDSFKDNPVLKGYIDLINQINECNAEITKAKDYLYESMLKENVDVLDGTYCQVTLKRPYNKTSVNTKKFLKDYTEDTEEYKKYVNIKQAKGNVSIKTLIKEGE